MDNIITGAVFNSGFAIAKNIPEAKSTIEAVEQVKMIRFPDQYTAYMAILKEFENKGARKHQLFPAPRFDEFVKTYFYSFESPEIIANRNKLKARFFTLWNLDMFGIFNDVDCLVSHFFALNADFLLEEVGSADEGVNDIFYKYAKNVFPVYPYSGGATIPMLGNLFRLNCLVKAPYIKYIATNCHIPDNLHALNPIYGKGDFGNDSLIGQSNDPANNIADELLQVVEIFD